MSHAVLPLLRRGVLALLVVAATGGCSRESGPRPSLHAVLPSIVVVGQPVDLFVSPLTDIGTPDLQWRGSLSVECTDPDFGNPAAFRGTGRGARLLGGVTFRTPGIHRVTVRSSDGLESVAGPVLVVSSEEDLRPRSGERTQRIFWGDAHGHSTVGDGTHPPEQYLYYAREIARLDFTCLSEHDYQQFLGVGVDETPGSWETIAEQARSWRRPGFAVLLGWEWSSRLHGHRVVLFPDDASRYVSFREARTPRELAEDLQGTGAFAVIAHPAGSRLTPPINWDTIAPGFDRAIEIYSGHGTMDGDPDFRPTSNPRSGASAVDALRRGFRFAVVAFSDTHLSTPGNPTPPPIRDAPYRGGLTAILATEPTESEVFAAIREGRCYATSGERFLVEFRAGDRTLGESLVTEPGEKIRVSGLAAAPGRWRRIEIMAGDRVERKLEAQGRSEIEFSVPVGPLPGGTALWLRGESESGERFWTTPIWVAAP